MGVSDEYEEMTIEEAELYEGQLITYLFDFGDMWEFKITVLDYIEENIEIIRPEIIESKGKSPEQYSM